MFNSTVLEIGIGLAFVYVILSLVCTAVTEAVSGLGKWRAKNLEQGIARLLGNEQFKNAFYRHPLIVGLGRPQRKPSYIPASLFVTTLLDLNAKPDEGVPVPSQIERVVEAFTSTAADRMRDLRGNLEQWFDDAMERVGGWYKRKVQVCLWIVAVIVAIAANADTLAIVDALATDRTVREAVVAAAEAAVRSDSVAAALQTSRGQGPQQGSVGPAADEITTRLRTVADGIEELEGLGIPLGWTSASVSFDAGWWLPKLIGLLLTAAALSLGAPFWFDALSKLTNLRASGGRPASSTGGTQAQDASRNAGTPGASAPPVG